MAGTGIGTFNDRLRDALRGGGPFDDIPEMQGFVTGLFYDPNGDARGSDSAQRDGCSSAPTGSRSAWPATSRTTRFVDRVREPSCAQIKSTTTASRPATPPIRRRLINYVDAHDNETLFDAIQLKAAGRHVDGRPRADADRRAVARRVLGQGVPVLSMPAASSCARSPSTATATTPATGSTGSTSPTRSNNWGVGLPPASSNQSKWPFMKPLLANPALRPTSDDIRSSLRRFRDLLQIRKGSPLFRLRTAAQVDARLSFANGGPDQIPGLIVMRLSDRVDPDLDPNAEEIIVFFNANDEDETLKLPDTRGRHFKLSKIQRTSDDEIVTESRFSSGNGTFFVPRRTTAVFVDQ